MAKENGLFKVLNSINYKNKIEYDKKDVNGYMLSMWLSADENLLNTINELNPYIFQLNDKLIYKYFFKKVPKRKRFLKWTKKEKISEKNQKKIDYLCLKYDISENEAKLSLKE